nr:autotransporter outer membrane beta-barrel domain-containing protein [Rhizobiaceae bacterium]
FAPASIAQGAVSTLTFTIDNSASPLDATALDFTDALPVAISVAANPNTSNTCTGGTLTANAGSSSISYTSGTVVGLATCEISVDVTSVTVGTHTNLTGDLTSSLGNSGTATDDLTVTAQAPPVFTKVFAPDSIVQGNVSTLTFTIDNSTSALDATALNFNDVLPTAIRIAASPNTSNTCTGGSLNATAGDGSISYSGGTVSAGATCEISVDVRSTSVGSHTNITDDLTSSLGNSGTATDILTVTAQAPPTFAKVFSPDTIRQGATSTLTFTIDNASSAIDATALAFADNMPAAILIATTPNVTNTCTGGTVIADSGTSLISYSGGTVGLGNSCTISVDVISTTVGTHINTTGDLISSLGNSGTATDQLTVTAQAPPTFTKVFTPDTIFQTDVSTLTFTIDNSTSLLAATSLNFTDNFPAAITVAGIPSVSNSCTGGTVTAAAGSSSISYTGGAVQPSTACEISVSVTSSTVGTHTNTSGALTSSLGDSGTATDDLTVNFQPNGNLTIVQNSDEDGTFGFSSSTAALNFSIVTAGGTGQQGRISLPAGTFVVQQVRPEGVGNTSISCDDGNSSGVSSMGVLTVQLAPLENVVCTFNSISTQQKTVDTINRFLTRRTDMILSNEPSSGRRIDRLKGSSNSTETVGFTPGDIPSLLPFDVETSGLQSGNVKVRTSLKQIKKSFATNSLVNSPEGETVTIDNSRFDLWFEGSYSRFDEGGSEGHFAIGYIGADYLLNPDLLVGAMVQFDDMEDVNRPDNSTISGTGWLLGPYLTARLSDNLYFDGRFAWGQSDNTVSPFNTYSDDFETERWLVSGSLTGEFEIEDFRLRPNITFSYIEEDQGAYTDSLNVAIPSQTVSLGQLRFGPNISTSFADENGTVFSPHFTIDGIYNFGDTEGVTVTNPETARSQGWRARAEAGVNISTTDGISLGVSGHYDGLGQSDVDLWGGSINLSIPLN